MDLNNVVKNELINWVGKGKVKSNFDVLTWVNRIMEELRGEIILALKMVTIQIDATNKKLEYLNKPWNVRVCMNIKTQDDLCSSDLESWWNFWVEYREIEMNGYSWE